MSSFVAWSLLILLCLIGVGVAIYATAGLMFLFGAPWVPTPKKVARELLEHGELKEGEVMIDLGSGDGSILLVALTEFGAKKAIGYELNPFLNMLARLRAKWHGVSDRLELHTANVYTAHFEKAHLVTTYLLEGMMDKLRPHLVEEIDDDTRVVSRGFRFTGKEKTTKKIGRNSYHRYTKQALK